ncbi:MAG TPA: Rpn family recombination-promoting nuclease/putative transposase [Planctomycetota bacterium]|nr:Rpn family recombination-promoting nuclease/putative transposase [Planctomycetota bacterium]
MHTPHDHLFHTTFRHPTHAAGWLRSILPRTIAEALDWSTLAPAAERVPSLRLRSHTADLVFVIQLRGSGRLVLLVIEHKANPDPHTTSQVLRYVVYLRRLGERQGAGRELLVVAVVLFHGDSPLPVARADEGLEAPLAAAFQALQPQLSVVIDDLTGRTESDLRRPGLTAFAQITLLCLRFLRHFTGPELAAIDRWGDLLRAIEGQHGPPPGEDALDAIGWYVLAVTDVAAEHVQMAFSKNLNRPTELIMSTLDKVRRQGRAEGHAEGRAEGHFEGQVSVLLRQLNRRFGPPPAGLVQRVQVASPTELERWLDRILDANTLDEVFAR